MSIRIGNGGSGIGACVKIPGDRPKYPVEIATIVVVLHALALSLPLLLLRENRISGEIPVRVFSLGPIPIILLLLPPLLALWYGYVASTRFSEYILSLCAIIGVLSPMAVLTFHGASITLELGPYARYSPASGFYLYLVATLVIFLMKRSMGWRDHITLGIIILGTMVLMMVGPLDRFGLILEARNLGSRLGREISAHLRITAISLAISVILGVPIALFSYQLKRMRQVVFPLLNVLQTIPGIALFGLLIAPLAALSQASPLLRSWGIKGIGNTPAIIALSIYALYPIIRYSYTAFRGIDAQVILAARGMGMDNRQIWRMVRFPLAAAGVLHGIRVALVQTIGNATLAKLIGGDGLGVLVFEGLGQASVDMVLLGMLLIIALTLVSDRLFQILIFLLTPKSLRNQGAPHG